MKYVTPAAQGGMKIPPGANHKTPYMDYRPTPGIMWKCVNGETGEWVTVEVPDVGGLTSTWCIGTVSGRAAIFYVDKAGVRYAQPTDDDPRAKDRELGSTRKRSRFMSALKKARAEEAERQGLDSGPEKSTTRERKPRAVKKRRAMPDLIMG